MWHALGMGEQLSKDLFDLLLSWLNNEHFINSNTDLSHFDLYQEIEGERNNNKFGINDTVYLRISTMIKHGDEYNCIIMGMLLLWGTVMSNFSSASSLSRAIIEGKHAKSLGTINNSYIGNSTSTGTYFLSWFWRNNRSSKTKRYNQICCQAFISEVRCDIWRRPIQDTTSCREETCLDSIPRPF